MSNLTNEDIGTLSDNASRLTIAATAITFGGGAA